MTHGGWANFLGKTRSRVLCIDWSEYFNFTTGVSAQSTWIFGISLHLNFFEVFSILIFVYPRWKVEVYSIYRTRKWLIEYKQVSQFEGQHCDSKWRGQPIETGSLKLLSNKTNGDKNLSIDESELDDAADKKAVG